MIGLWDYFFPTIINGHQLKESRQLDFQQIQKEDDTFHEHVIVSFPQVLDMEVQLEKVSIKEEKYGKIEKLIIRGQKELIAFKEDEINIQSLDFVVCPKFEFVIELYEQIEVYIVEFEMGDSEKSYYLERTRLKFGRKLQHETKSN